MTKTNWGLKRICPTCAARFYDLGKNPATCPKCGKAHDITVPVKARRAKKTIAVDMDEPLIKAKAKADLKQKIKKPVKEIEDIDLGEFEDIETLDAEEEIEELEEIEDIESIEELEEVEDASKIEEIDDENLIEDEAMEATLMDDVEDDEESDADDEEDDGKAKSTIKRPVIKVKKKGKK